MTLGRRLREGTRDTALAAPQPGNKNELEFHFQDADLDGWTGFCQECARGHPRTGCSLGATEEGAGAPAGADTTSRVAAQRGRPGFRPRARRPAPPPTGSSPALLTLPRASAPTRPPRARASEAAAAEGAPASRKGRLPDVPPRPPHVPTEQAKWRRRARSRQAGLPCGPRVRRARAATDGPPRVPAARQPPAWRLRHRGRGETVEAGCRRRRRTRTPLSASPAGAAARSSRGGRRWGRGKGGDGRREGGGRGGAQASTGRLRAPGCRARPCPPALWAFSPRGRLRWRAAHPARRAPVRTPVLPVPSLSLSSAILLQSRRPGDAWRHPRSWRPCPFQPPRESGLRHRRLRTPRAGDPGAGAEGRLVARALLPPARAPSPSAPLPRPERGLLRPGGSRE